MHRILLIFLALLPSCSWLPRATTIPVKALESGNRNGTEMVVFLPGRWSCVEEFEREGVLKIARERWPEARLMAPDLHLGYYKNRSMTQRLHEDVISPALRDGVKSVRLVGISLGGFGAIAYELEHPGNVDEIILLSPYLGEEEALKEIRDAGGLEKWRAASVEDADFSRNLWVGLRDKWLKGSRPRVLLGCGLQDRLAPGSRLFADEFLKPGEQEWVPGGHDWKTWRALFGSLSAR
jgi:hypothetical protein